MKGYIAVLISLLVCQSIKAILFRYEYGRFNLWVLVEDGGMPSAYATGLASVTTAIGLVRGADLLFVLSVLVTLIICSEVMKVKRKTDIQPEHMARFIDVRDIIRRKLQEGTPHTPENVFSGLFLGVVVTSVIFLF